MNVLAFSYLDLPAVNAALNLAATLLLVAGYALIKARRETAHKWAMLSAFGVSSVFLVSYLTYHQVLYANEGIRGRPFAGPEPLLSIYRVLLLSHVVLAVTVPLLAGMVMYYGFRDDRPRHIRWARRAFPIWLYVSVTGVVIYVLLYHVYPPGGG